MNTGTTIAEIAAPADREEYPTMDDGRSSISPERVEAGTMRAIAARASIATYGLPAPSVRRVPARRLAHPMRAAVALIGIWYERARQRTHLAALDARMLRDIGVAPDEAERECNKPFWRA
jgi:uncharacterized protein YjiS (DUF1127 family)